MSGQKLGLTGFKLHDEKIWGNYRAKVVANNDPLGQGRIKAEVIPYFVGIDPDIIPWAVPKHPCVVGAGNGIGSSFIPAVGTKVWVFFEMGDVYQPVYDGEAPDGVDGILSFMETNYPHRRGFVTSSGITFYIDDTATTVNFIHPTGTSVIIGTNGSVTIGSTNAVIIQGTTVSINPS